MDNMLDYNQQKLVERQKADTFHKACWISQKNFSERDYGSFKDGQTRKIYKKTVD